MTVTTPGDLLKQSRLACGLRREQVAARIGCSFSTIASYERNLSTPSVQMLVDLATVYNVPASRLLNFFTEKPAPQLPPPATSEGGDA